MQLDPKKHQPLPDGRVRIRGGGVSKGGPVALLIFSLFWLAVSGTMLYFITREDGWNFGAWFVSLFVLVGVAIFVGGVVVLVRAMMVNARIQPATIICSRLPLRLGDAFEIEYEQHVRARCKIEQVTLKLACREWVRYRVGTDTRTAEHDVFEEEAVLLTAGELAPPQYMTAAAQFTIPAEGMHSFEASDNKITWRLVLTTSIASWPDFAAAFPLVVAPLLAPSPPAGAEQ